MGREKDAEWRRVVFAGYQVNEALMVELVGAGAGRENDVAGVMEATT